MSPKWMSVLLRARQTQEDVAKQALASAERGARQTQARVRYDSERLDVLCANDKDLHAPAFIASAVALQAAAASLAASVQSAHEAEARTAARREALRGASRARHTAEQLEERAVLADELVAAAVAQRDLDEVAARVHRRASGDEQS